MGAKQESKLAKCGRCKTLFVRAHSHVCERCVGAEDSDFIRIRDVVAERPYLGPEELAEKASVPVACVLRMMDQDLLAAQGDEALCGRCGAPAINVTQRLCTGCLYDLDRELSVELNAIRMKLPQSLRGVAHHVHAMLSSKRRG